MDKLDGTKGHKLENTQDFQEKIVEKELTFALTEEDFAEKGKVAGRAAEELNKLNAEFDRIKKDWKTKIDNKRAELSTVLTVIRACQEKRKVKCIEQKDFNRNMVSYIFNKTVMHERAIETHEKQMSLVKNKKEEKVDGKMAAAGDQEKADLMEVIKEEKKGLR